MEPMLEVQMHLARWKVGSAIHVTKYRNEPRDYSGEVVDLAWGKEGLQAKVLLFSCAETRGTDPDVAKRGWRRFHCRLAEVE